MTDALVISIQVGQARVYPPAADDAAGAECASALKKQAISGPVMLSPAGVSGDMQADTVNHGGPDRAVLVYARRHYPVWEREWGRALPPGSFGENFTVAGQDEYCVSIGDIYALGGCRLQVAYPRQPCAKLDRVLRRPGLERAIRSNFRSGWFLRVLQGGEVAAGQPLRLQARPYPQWTIGRVSEIMYHEPENHAAARALASVSDLAWAWRKKFAARAGG